MKFAVAHHTETLKSNHTQRESEKNHRKLQLTTA